MNDVIKIKGARQHNLKNVSVDIPKNKFVVMTGISGSGKSSLAFDTVYAEGQRRYVESLSAYARQFLGVMDKPDVDSIEGLSPSISIDQKTVTHNPRSTVGTITEIYDYLRVLFARIGHPHCPKCEVEIAKLSPDEITARVEARMVKATAADKIKPHRFQILSPVVNQKKGEFKDLLANLMSKGYAKAFIDGYEKKLSDEIDLIKTNKHSIAVVIDEISATYSDLKNELFLANIRSRLSSSIEQSLNLAAGLVILKIAKNDHLFSENFSCPNCSLSLPEIEPRMFSFNSPIGACDKCKGIGTLYRIDPELVLNLSLSINEGAILPFNKFYFHDTWYARLMRTVAAEEKIDLNIPAEILPKDKIKIVLYGTDKVYRVIGKNRFGRETAIYEKFDGVVGELERRYFESNGDYAALEIQKYMREETCYQCNGKKLKPEVLSITIDKKNIAAVSDLSVSEITDFFKNSLPLKLNSYESQVARPILKEIITRLNFLQNVGLSYLTISRTARTLSGGELQRIRLASQIGTGLTGVLYVLDEPSIGLHPKDVSALIQTLKNLRDLGNTLVVVEHDKETIQSADYLIELGPRAGKDGGHIVAQGDIKSITRNRNSLTGSYLNGKRRIREAKRKLNDKLGRIFLKKASQFNLKGINVEFPLGNLIAVTGVSGSGKSTLVVETLYPALKYYLDGHYAEHIGKFERLEGYQYIDRAYLVDQSPIGRTPRSNPATYIGLFDEIRNIYAATVDARAKGFQKGRFSFNIKGGRCEKCQGAGSIKIEMQFLADVYVTCDICRGMRYNQETLEVKYKGKNIYEILKMTVDEAADFFSSHPAIYQKLSFLKKVGLGYIELGQAAPTFSGGEAQRIKLAHELSKRETGKTLYILDEPTTGLHFYDVDKLLQALYELVDKGNTVVIIEHNLDVIKNCQYVVDLGPEGGDRGGYLVYQGKTEAIVNNRNSFTGQYLKKVA
jgi:excinuclease ABC subunit A